MPAGTRLKGGTLKLETYKIMNKSILWVTPDYFLDTDINIVPKLCQEISKIHWIILFNDNNNRFKENDFDELISNNKNLSIFFLNSKCRKRSPFRIFYYLQINRIINKKRPDLIYINDAPTTPWQIPMFFMLPVNKWINTAHQGEIHAGFKYKGINRFLRNIVYKRVKYINMFSKSQALLMHKNFPDAKIYQFVLGLKDFGKPSIQRDEGSVVKFLSFGTINYGKHIDLLIDAACNIYERGYKNFRVIIKGVCENKDDLLKHVRYPEIFEIDLRAIDNSEIPNLFNSSHFFVQPYRFVTQSGPFKIAMNYNIPLITSDLPGFMDEMKEGVTGFSFKSENILSLENILIKSINIYSDKSRYSSLCKEMKDYVNKKYSIDVLVKQYKDMFLDVQERIY